MFITKQYVAAGLQAGSGACAIALLAIAMPAAGQAPPRAGATPDRRLVDAARSGDRAAAVALLARRVNANVGEPDGTTALHWAARHDDVYLVERLLQAGASVGAANRQGVTALSEAAIVGNPAMLTALLKAGADVNATNPEGQTALMAVARTGNVDAAEVLFAKGANVNAAEHWRGQTALMWAAADCQPAMTKALIVHGADVNARSKVNKWERDVTAEPRPKDMPAGGGTPLLLVAREGCLESAKVLLEAGADPNLQDPNLVPPAVTAIVNGHFDVAAYLLGNGAAVNLADRWGRAMLWAVVDMHTTPHSGRPDVLESESMSSMDLMKLVLAKGADVNAQLALFPPYRSPADRGSDGVLTIGATPLLRAAKAGDVEAMTLLLDYRANPNTPTVDGITPLLAAAGVGSRDSDTRGRDKTEQSAVASVNLLLDRGAAIDAADSRGQTAMHGAAFWGFNDLVKTLAKRGAKLDVKDRGGMTPVDSAMGRAGGNGFGGNRIDVHQDTADLLRQLSGLGTD